MCWGGEGFEAGLVTNSLYFPLFLQDLLPLLLPDVPSLTWAGLTEAGLRLVLRAWAVLQHWETGWGAASTPTLNSRPAGLTAWLPWAPGAPDSTILLIQGGLCFI